MVFKLRIHVLVTFVFGLTLSGAYGGVVFVNNLSGSDTFDGSAARTTASVGGPVKTFRRAVRIARKGDTISIANTGIDYHDSIQLTGTKNSGFKTRPFTIEGNGATISGACPIPQQGWKELPNNLWQMRPRRKGHYLLLFNGKPLPEKLPGYPAEDPAEGQWTVRNGSMIYHPREGESPMRNSLSFAYETTGISLFHVRNVRIRNLTLKHFRLDGVGVHNLARNITLENVTCIQNGRAGVTVRGSSAVDIDNCTVKENRRNSIRIEELGTADVNQSDIVPPPSLVD